MIGSSGDLVIENQRPLTLDGPITRWPDILQIFTACGHMKVLNEQKNGSHTGGG